MFGHSFVRRLRTFISGEKDLAYNFNMYSRPMVQYSGYSGASVHSLRRNIEAVSDFNPKVVILLIGTNDLSHANNSPLTVCANIMELVEMLLQISDVQHVIVGQILHRLPSNQSRHPVDIPWFNKRVDETNLLLSERLKGLAQQNATFWRLKGFWSPEAQSTAFHADGVHLSDIGQRKLYHNLRAAVVSTLNSYSFV